MKLEKISKKKWTSQLMFTTIYTYKECSMFALPDISQESLRITTLRGASTFTHTLIYWADNVT